MNNKIFIYSHPLSVKDLSKEINVLPSEIIKFFFMQKKNISINYILNEQELKDICLKFGVNYQKEEKNDDNCNKKDINKSKNLKERPPVVTIMGHVDHGKTTLIDVIFGSNNTKKEAGGISQSIGAYQKEVNGKKITFIDTPGHEVFEKIRIRGASITDIVVLVVAADDGVMPQTIEVINQTQKLNIPVIVAINKIDKENINIKKVKNDLMNYGIISEEFGGKNIFCEISAKKNIGIDNLLDNIILLSEILELKADYDCDANGIVLESQLHKNKGPIANLLVQNGSLKKGDYIVIDTTFGCVREMFDKNNKNIEIAFPSTPVLITGLDNVPSVGHFFYVFKNKKDAQKEVDKNKKKIVNSNVDNTNNNCQDKVLNLLICTDFVSSAEAIKNCVSKINVPGVKVKIIRVSTGIINDNDIMLAKIDHAIIYVFNVKINSDIKKRINSEKITICEFNIIYHLIEDIEKKAKKMLKPSLSKNILGRMEVKKIFHFSKTNIAGCYVIDGVIKKKSKIDLIRNGINVYSGEIVSLKHQKDNIDEAKKGSECGAILHNFNDIKENDLIVSYEFKKVDEE